MIKRFQKLLIRCYLQGAWHPLEHRKRYERHERTEKKRIIWVWRRHLDLFVQTWPSRHARQLKTISKQFAFSFKNISHQGRQLATGVKDLFASWWYMIRQLKLELLYASESPENLCCSLDATSSEVRRFSVWPYRGREEFVEANSEREIFQLE